MFNVTNIRELEIKITMRYHLTFVSMAIKNTKNNELVMKGKSETSYKLV